MKLAPPHRSGLIVLFLGVLAYFSADIGGPPLDQTEKIRYEGTVISDRSFKGARLNGVSFIRTVCRRCDFRDADLSDAVFIRVDAAGSLFNKNTRLPFSKDYAVSIGMVESNE